MYSNELRLMIIRNRIDTLSKKGPHNTALVNKLRRRERLLVNKM